MSQSNEAEVRWKFTTDAAGMLQAVNQLTGEVMKLGKAEDEVKKKVEAAKLATLERLAVAKELKAFNASVAAHEAGPAPAALTPRQQAEKIVEARRAAKQVQDEVDRLDPKKVEAPLTPRQQAMKNLEAKRFADAVKSEMERLSPSAPSKSHAESVRESALKAMDQARELRAAGLNGSGMTIREQIEQASISRQQSKALNAATARHELLGGEGFGVAARRFMGLGGVAVGMGAAALGAAGGWAERSNQINATPWLSAADRQRQQREAVPVFGWAERMGREIADARTGRGSQIAGIERRAFATDIQQQTQIEYRQAEFQRQQSENEARAQAFGQGARTPQLLRRVDLGTVAGERQRREEEMMLPSRQKADAARAEQSAAADEHTRILRQRNTLGKNIAQAEKELAETYRQYKTEEAFAARRGTTSRETPALIELRKNTIRQNDALIAMKGEDFELAQRQEAAAKRRATADRDMKESGAEAIRDRMNVLSDRAGRAAGRDVGLGMAGPEQRMMAEQALRMLRQGRFEDMPSELKQAAAQHFPEEVRKMAEQAGGRLREGGYGRGEDEYKYGLKETRESLDRARDDYAKAQVDVGKEFAKSIADVIAADRAAVLTAFAELVGQRNFMQDLQRVAQASPAGR